MRNVVQIEISSANPDAPRLIVEHYAEKLGIPTEMLDVVSDGTGVKLLPFGWVKGVVVQADGSEPGYNDLMVDGRGATPGTAVGATWATASGTTAGSSCRARSAHGRSWYWRPRRDDGEWIVVGSADVTVRADETVRIRIRLDKGADVTG